MEQLDESTRAWVFGCVTGTFAERTRDAGECEVSGLGPARFYHRHNVVHMKPSLLSGLRQTAIFATISRPLQNFPSQPLWDRHAA